MTGTAKVKSGSKAGKVQYPYDAMVYIDGTTVYAVDKEGNVIRRGVAGTDDSAVVQAAINSLSAYGHCILRGSFTFNSSVLIYSSNVTIDLGGSYIYKTVAPDPIFVVGDGITTVLGVKITNGRLQGPLSATITEGLKINGAKNCEFHSLYIDGFNVGLSVDGGAGGTWYNFFSNLIVARARDSCIKIEKTGVGNCNSSFFSNCVINGSVITGLNVTTGNLHTFTNCNIEGSTVHDISVTGNASVAMLGGRIEHSTGDVYVDATGVLEIVGSHEKDRALTFGGTRANVFTYPIEGQIKATKITVGATNCNYTTIAAALQYIVSYGAASESNQYLIEVYGSFTERWRLSELWQNM